MLTSLTMTTNADSKEQGDALIPSCATGEQLPSTELDEGEKLRAKIREQAHDITALRRERESLLKMVAGMAIRRYRYDPHAHRSVTPQAIASDLALIDLSLDADTIRRHLRQAIELVPSQG